MMSDTRVSVVVPVYNIEQYIGKCIDSLLAQDYEKIEIILVDDGSKDNSGYICDQYKENHNQKIKVVHKKNGGLSDARNAGVEVAEGKYVIFLDGDDYVDQEYVSSLLNSLVKNNVTMACSPLIFEYADGNQKTSQSFAEKVVSTEEMIDIVFRAKYSIGVSACSKIIRIEDVKKHPFPVGKYHEDMITIEDIILENERMAIFPHPTYHYVQRKTSITYADVNFDSLNYGIEYLENKAYNTKSSICRNAYIHRMFGLMNTYCRVIDVKKNRKKLSEVQKTLRRNIGINIKDKESSVTDKVKNILLCCSTWSFAILQNLEKRHAHRAGM